jgi:tetratricopeptide (TPR) repeat protein
MSRHRTRTTPVSCPVCRIKVGPTRDRCPRCLTLLSGTRPGGFRQERRLAQVAGGLLAVFFVGFGAIYLAQPAAGDDVTVAPPDPLAARRIPPPDAAADLSGIGSAPVSRPAPFEPVADLPLHPTTGGDAALSRLRSTIAQHPRDAEAHSAMGELLVGLSRTEEALPFLQGAVALNPERPAYHLALARALTRLERWEDALVSYRTTGTLDPENAAITTELVQVLQQARENAAPREDTTGAAADTPTALPRQAIGDMRE